jgi:DNA-binding MurR/RpiR family transcriptional regulator
LYFREPLLIPFETTQTEQDELDEDSDMDDDNKKSYEELLKEINELKEKLAQRNEEVCLRRCASILFSSPSRLVTWLGKVGATKRDGYAVSSFVVFRP